MIIHSDCRNFRGDIPCKPHKQLNVHCDDCEYYDPIQEKIFIIKLGAIGDVIRTTPLLTKIKEVYPNSIISWLTHTPEILPSSIDRIFSYNLPHIEILKNTKFDFVYNLDKDREACALINRIHAKIKKGFWLADGNCHPIDEQGRHKWITGLFDDGITTNLKSYPQEIFEICGFQYQLEEYILEVPVKKSWNLDQEKTTIGLNTGCGNRWKTRLWPESYWVNLAKTLKDRGYEVLLLGGTQEDEKNIRVMDLTGVKYFGPLELPIFIDLMNQCELVVTAVTLALHIAIGLKKKVVLFNNIFNSHEFELFGRGNILEPPVECRGCFMNECDKPCMELIQPNDVLDAVHSLLK